MLSSFRKPVWRKFLPVWVLGALFFLAACENDLESIKKIANMNSGGAIDTTRGVDVIYSDSAIVKGRLITPLLIKYGVEKPYDVMPDGVKIILFDKNGKAEMTIVADSAVQMENENLSKLYKNVVITSADGTVCKSEEMIWDQQKKIIYSDRAVEMRRPNGDEFFGQSFISDDKLDHPEVRRGNGEGEAPENFAQ